MAVESLSDNLAARGKNDLLKLYVHYMTRKKSDFDVAELAANVNWACATTLNGYAVGLDRRWEGFVRALKSSGTVPDLPWSREAEMDDERPGESDKLRLKEELLELAKELDPSRKL